MKKQSGFKTKGMNRDLSVSAFNPDFSFENVNLRLSATESNHLLSWVNEKGTSDILLFEEDENGDLTDTPLVLSGIALGTAILNDYLVLFTTGASMYDITGSDSSIETSETSDPLPIDCIYRLRYANDEKTIMKGVLLYYGPLNLDVRHPLETLVSYEAENIQKVYWTDGKNQPRLINITPEEIPIEALTVYDIDSQFDFVRELQLQEEVSVKKLLGGNGMFAPGVIQYAFTYYDKYGQESNIFYTTQLIYVSFKDRGAGPDERVANSFKITVTNVDTNFDYLRIYSIHRTSIDAVPICKRVQDIYIGDLKNSAVRNVSFTDIGDSGDSIDPMELLYKGGDTVTVGTMDQKDGTLFMGDITTTRPQIEQTMKTAIRFSTTITTGTRTFYPLEVYKQEAVSPNNYVYYNQLCATDTVDGNTVPCSGFRYGNYYRLGVQFQYKTGKWSEPVLIQQRKEQNNVVYWFDWFQNQVPVSSEIASGTNAVTIQVPVFKGSITKRTAGYLYAQGYRKIRPVMVMPKLQDRRVICQGVVCPTVYTDRQRNSDKSLYGQSSWFFRVPYSGNSVDSSTGTVVPYASDGSTLESTNYIPYTNRAISGTGVYSPSNIRQVEVCGEYEDADKFKIDRYFLTLHSPDIVFDEAMTKPDFVDVKYEYRGTSGVLFTLSDIDIQTETPTISNIGSGFVHKTFSHTGSFGIVTGLFYDDFCVDEESNGEEIRAFKNQRTAYKWFINPWHKDGSLNNDFNRPEGRGVQSAVLKKKVISNLRYFKTELRTNGVTDYPYKSVAMSSQPQLYDSEEASILKVGNKVYQGNINTVLLPKHADGSYFAYDPTSNGETLQWDEVIAYITNNDTVTLNIAETDSTSFTSNNIWKTFSAKESGSYQYGLYKFNSSPVGWDRAIDNIGNTYLDLVLKKDLVRMKYKSTPHLVLYIPDIDTSVTNNPFNYDWDDHSSYLPVLDIVKNTGSVTELGMSPEFLAFMNTIYGGNNDTALRENIWIPCGEPVSFGLDDDSAVVAEARERDGDIIIPNPDWDGPDPINPGTDDDSGSGDTGDSEDSDDSGNEGDDSGSGSGSIVDPTVIDPENNIYFEYSFGDTYYQRYDCLKTYPMNNDDINQIVEIGSFMLESYVNIDGRYDRNRGQINNLNMTPLNFNLLNPVYSQTNNFFTYRIVDKDFYKINEFPNQVTWSKTKESGADVDQWTNVTLTSMMELDGDKGKISKIVRFNDQLIAFQDTGICQILYNENTQISSADGVPIEIANSGKVQGKRYLSTTVGCSNKWSMAVTPSGIYFMDNNDKGIYLFSGKLDNVSIAAGFSSWCRQYVPPADKKWDLSWLENNELDGFENFSAYYDKLDKDVYFINKDTALAYSEKAGAFTSFYDYGNQPFFCNFQDTGIWVNMMDFNTYYHTILWKHHGGEYCKFFNQHKPYSMTLVGNPDPIADKTFTNLEFRACVKNDGKATYDQSGNLTSFIPYLPFDSLETWSEYQHGITPLCYKNGHESMMHHIPNDDSSLKRKFRIWRCDIPRDNASRDSDYALGIARYKPNPMARMRNPWLYIKLKKEAATSSPLPKAEVHDVVLTYHV